MQLGHSHLWHFKARPGGSAFIVGLVRPAAFRGGWLLGRVGRVGCFALIVQPVPGAARAVPWRLAAFAGGNIRLLRLGLWLAGTRRRLKCTCQTRAACVIIGINFILVIYHSQVSCIYFLDNLHIIRF